MLKYSRQRECIRENLVSRCDHPTAEMVYEDVRKTFPNISLGTVYRNLTLLAEQGDIARISMRDGPDRYDGSIHTHVHFLCSECHGIWDIDPDEAEQILSLSLAHFDGDVEKASIQLMGVCGSCRKQ